MSSSRFSWKSYPAALEEVHIVMGLHLEPDADLRVSGEFEINNGI